MSWNTRNKQDVQDAPG